MPIRRCEPTRKNLIECFIGIPQCVASRAYWQERGEEVTTFFSISYWRTKRNKFKEEIRLKQFVTCFLILKIAKFFVNTEQNRKYVFQTKSGSSYFKLTSIVTVQDLWKFATFLTPLRYHCLISLISLMNTYRMTPLSARSISMNNFELSSE